MRTMAKITAVAVFLGSVAIGASAPVRAQYYYYPYSPYYPHYPHYYPPGYGYVQLVRVGAITIGISKRLLV